LKIKRKRKSVEVKRKRKSDEDQTKSSNGFNAPALSIQRSFFSDSTSFSD